MLIRVNSIFLKNKLNIIYTAHGFHFYNGAPILNWLVYFPIEKLLSKYVNILITINKEDFELGKRKFKNINNIFLVNGVGVNRKKFSPTDRKTKMELKKKFNVPSEDFIFLSVAEFNKNKNHKLILQFVKQLSKKIYNFKVFLVGIGPSFEKIVKLCKHLDLDKHVIFLGYRNDIEKLYKISDIFIATSKREGLPLSMIEAMTAGLPIIATKNRGHNSLINHGRNGYLYENNNPISFCQGALNLIQSKDTYNQISKNNISDSKIYSQEFIDIDMKNIYIKSLS